uniref:antirestriction protein ArdA n=1 Tax=Acetatifactor aquisgranensis TaxID=2941233 RepID=UPI00203C8441
MDDMAVYIANLGKYNEGYLVGAWFTFPIDEEDVKGKIGLNELSDGELRETQMTNYFSNLYPIDCAV